MQSVHITINVVKSTPLRRGALDTTWRPWCNWNIVESGVKHHNSNQTTSFINRRPTTFVKMVDQLI